ncbi:MAG: M28 family peptidase [Candidatus Bathyarchaeota archaeon]|nr:M28 family peptidase [Candidatus Bathyarchaeota archaeon]
MLRKIVSGVMLTLLSMVVLTFGFNAQSAGVDVSVDVFSSGGLTLNEAGVVALVDGSEAYSFDMQLESIALSHHAFRAAGSAGADEAADWIAGRFESFGLEVEKEEFQFTSWDLLGEPTLVIDEDGDFATVEDQFKIESFQCAHYSLPGDVFADLVVLPLPPAANPDEVGAVPIGTLWDAIDTTDKVVLVGREIRSDGGWQETFSNKLRAHPPAAVIYTWWYSWMSFVPDFFSSGGGLPIAEFGHYFWDSDIAVGSVDHEDGLLIVGREVSVDVSAKVVIDSIIDVEPHFNIVGRLTGYEEPEKTVIVSGHYDTVMTAGFCDNGAGTSGVIELASVFTDAVKRGLYYPKYSIVFVAFAGEEIWLVGSINYVMQHEAEMKDIAAVINLDCIGSDDLYVAETNPSGEFDLDELVLTAAGDLNISVALTEPGGSDQEVFRDPTFGNDIYSWVWELWAGIDDATPVESSTMLISYPIVYGDKWAMGTPGWIHTSYDSSTSTETLNWVEIEDLENHIKVAALTVMRVDPPVEHPIAVFAYEPQTSWVNETITFDATQSYSPSGNITSYTWSFADENVTVTGEPRINYTFSKQGSYNVTLEIIDETFLTDSISTIVNVTYRTDLNKDGIVDIMDIALVAKAYETKPEDPNWNEIADLDENDIIDIRDIAKAVKDYGKTV